MKKLFLSCMIFTTPFAAQAAGFALIEQSASGMGNAFAGGGAVAEDASTIFFNPAGMTYIQGTQLVGAAHLIKPSADFTGTANFPGPTAVSGGNGGDAGDLAFVPNLYFKMDLNDSVKLGIGLSAPFGLKTEYDSTWKGRFHAVKSELKTININPAVAYKVNDQLSVGAGLSAMWAQAELTNAVNFGRFGEGNSKIKGDDWGFGYNLGAIYQATTDTRISAAYRSKVNQTLKGEVTFVLPNPALAGAAPNGPVTAKVALPESLSMSAFSRIDDKWDVMGDITWTRWSQFKELKVVRDNGAIVGGAATPENWSNTLRYSIGANYHYNDAVKLRAGLAYDEEAISDQFRTARIPGNDRKWLSIGADWKVSPSSSIDVGYSHLFISDASIDSSKNEPSRAKGVLKGSYDGSVDILSAQYTHNF